MHGARYGRTRTMLACTRGLLGIALSYVVALTTSLNELFETKPDTRFGYAVLSATTRLNKSAQPQ
jgi:hypothetical protein